MSRGKYSPSITRALADRSYEVFSYNAYKETPPEWVKGEGDYDEKTHFGNYDSEGFDSYGYSAWNEDGSYAGIGDGIDRLGNTELDYLRMSDDDFNVFL